MYGFSVSGMTLHFNYCCGSFSSIELVPSDTCDEMMGEQKCCSDFQLHASNDDATFSKPLELIKFQAEAFPITPLCVFYIESTLMKEKSFFFRFETPPLQRPVYLKNRVLLI
jgi:hypothetical protein